MNARAVRERPWRLNRGRAASPARKQNAHASEPKGPTQRDAPAKRGGSTHREHDVVSLHVGSPCLFLSGTGQKRPSGLRAANKEAVGCGGAFQSAVCSFGDSLGVPVG